MHKKMVGFFLGVIIVFALLAAFFLFKNNFAVETIDIIFPTIGAILLSLYLGFKGVYLDNPEPKTTEFRIACLINTKTGFYSSLAKPNNRINSDDLSLLSNGIGKLDKLQKKFPSLELKKLVKENPLGPPGFTQDLFFYVFWDWINYTPQNFTFIGDYNRNIEVNQVPYTMGSHLSNTPLEHTSVDIPHGDNLLLKLYKKQIKLPPNSVIICKNKFDYLIKTKNSEIRIFRTSGVSKAIDPNSDFIKNLFLANDIELNENDFKLQYYNIQIQFNQNPFTRFSKAAKIEKEWYTRLIKEFEISFSWNILRNFYKEQFNSHP